MRRASHLSAIAARGFTLLEVLIALAVLAIALGALVKVGAQQADALDHLRTRTFAEWVAADQLARLRLREPWPDTGELRGTSAMGQRDWYWVLRVSDTDEPNVRRLEVQVFTEPGAEDSIVTLSGFAGRY